MIIRLPFAVVIGLFLVLGVWGGVSAWFSIRWQVLPRLANIEKRLAMNAPIEKATSTEPAIRVIPVVERRAANPQYPSIFSSRHWSPVLTLVKKPTGKNDEAYIHSQKAVSRVVAVTTDGWLVTTKSALASIRVGDVEIDWNGELYPIFSIIRDTATDLVYLKIQANNLPVPAFVRAADVASGLGVWAEPAPQRLYPDLIADIRLHAADALSSEKTARRFLVAGSYAADAAGGALWDSGGQFVGLLEAPSFGGGWNVIPAGLIPDVLSALLSGGEIVHPFLGVRGVDLSTVSFQRSSSNAQIPTQGVWLHTDRKTGFPAIIVKGPADGLLKEGDVIERVERDILDGTADLGERLLEYQPGATVTFSGKRSGETFSVQIKLGNHATSEHIK